MSSVDDPADAETVWTAPEIVWEPTAQDAIGKDGPSDGEPGTGFTPRPVPPFQPARYTFMVSSFSIANTRARQEDTDFISETVTIDEGASLTVVGPSPPENWNLNNGTFPQGGRWALGPLEITDPARGVSFAYQITNTGHHDWDTINKTLTDSGQQLARWAAAAVTAELNTIVGGAGTVLGPWIGQGLGWVMGQVTGLVAADCDGPVASALVSMKGTDLWALTQNGQQASGTYTHPGLDSHVGCGSNSLYYTTWHILRS